jgi:hypothetical protein
MPRFSVMTMCHSEMIKIMPLLVLFTALPGSAATKIMCLGNSISEGSSTNNTYRSYLYKSLVAKGYQVDFVGDNKGTCNNRNAGTQDNWDDDHCCFYSAKASQILNGNMPVNSCSPAGDGNIHDWAPRYKPDIAIIHLGTTIAAAG